MRTGRATAEGRPWRFRPKRRLCSGTAKRINVTSPLYHEGKLYWASDKGIACCLNAADGAEVYRERIRHTRSRIYASAVLAGGKIYITTRDAGIIVAAPGSEYQELSVNRILGDDSFYNATPAISNGQLFTRTDRFLYCIGERQ